MTLKTKSNLRWRLFFLAFCVGSGIPPLLFAESPSIDGWQPRATEITQEPTLVHRHFPAQSSNQESISQPYGSDNSQTHLRSPQHSNSTLNWIPAGQIPASPWDRPSAAQQQRGSRQSNTEQENSRTNALPHPNDFLPDRTIRQPISSASTSRSVPSKRVPNVAQMIEQPKISGRTWQQIPDNGQIVEFDEQRPIVGLGWPIPTDSTVSTPTAEAYSGQSNLPLEAKREQRMGSSDAARRATRSPEPHPKEVGQVNPMDYLSSSPSTVVGVVAVPSSQNRYAEVSGQPPMNTFVPSHEESSHVVPASMADSDATSSRMRLASQVSRELLGGNQQSLGMAPIPVEPPAGWQNVEKNLRGHLTKCDELLRRNAILSAREEILMGLRVLFRALDLRSGEWTSEPAFDQALAAFAEESDFHQSLRNPTHAQSTARIVSGHATQALKQVDLEGVSPELAAQHYRAYARQQLVKAAQGHPWAADLLYAFGKTYERRAESTNEDGFMFYNQAIACYTASLDVSPNHIDGANQLGYTLMKLDRMDEAHAILSQATQTHPSTDAWKNLAELYRRRGQMDQAAIAVQQATALGMPSGSNTVPEVYQVDPQTFVGLSPNQFMSPGAGNGVQASSPVAAPAAPPAKSTSWFSRLVR